jgi:hypothetical protein
MKQTKATAVHYRRSVRRAASRGLPINILPSASFYFPDTFSHRGKNVSEHKIGVFLATFVVLALLILLGAASYHAVATHGAQSRTANRNAQGLLLSDGAKQQLEIDLSDANLAADIATLRTYQKALTDVLAITAANLKSDPRDQTFLKRKQLIQALLTNAGGTGVNDQLAAIEAAQRMVASHAVSTQADEARVRGVMANIRINAESWKTGALANAGKLVGLRWQEGKGLAISTPYIWGIRGWEEDPVSASKNMER